MLKAAGADAAWRAYGVGVTEGWREDGFVLFADAAAGRRRVAAPRAPSTRAPSTNTL